MNPYLTDEPLNPWSGESRDALYFKNKDHQQAQHDAVHEHLPDTDGISLLDYGCGFGDFSKRVDAFCDYLGVDASRRCIDAAKESYPNREFKVGIEVVPADVIVAVAVLQCAVVDPLYLLAEFRRNAKLLSVLTVTRPLWDELTPFVQVSFDLFNSEDDFYTVVMKS